MSWKTDTNKSETRATHSDLARTQQALKFDSTEPRQRQEEDRGCSSFLSLANGNVLAMTGNRSYLSFQLPDDIVQSPGIDERHPCRDALTDTPQRRILTGKVVHTLYDCCGDFEGFVMLTCEGAYTFSALAKGVEEIVSKAFRFDQRLSVWLTITHDKKSCLKRLALLYG